MRIETNLAREAAEVESVAAAGIEDNIARARGHHLGDRQQQRLRYAAIVQSPPRCDGVYRIARMLRSTLLRLEQVDIPAARDVERMPLRTHDSPFFARQRQMAAPYGAKKHDRL